MRVYRNLLIALIAVTVTSLPMGISTALADNPGKAPITPSKPQIMASAEKDIPKAKKSIGKSVAWGILGVVVLGLVAAGSGGGGGDGGSNPEEGSVTVEW